MNILYLIGNGFDLAQGLKTSYKDFYDYFCSIPPVNFVEQKMIEEIKGDHYEKWSDLEVALGNFTDEIDSKDEFEAAYYDLCNRLREYLIEQVKDFSPSNFIIDKYIGDLVRPDSYLSAREQYSYAEFFGQFSDSRNIKIVSFNYTDTIDKCLDFNNPDRKLPSANYSYQRYPIVKVHGTLGTSYLLMGVDNKSQIANPLYAEDENVWDYLVKPFSNLEIGTRVDDFVSDSIKYADLIIAMGLSFGVTDQTWWKKIGARLKANSNIMILLFVHVNNLPSDARQVQPIKRRIKKEFLGKCGIEEESSQAVYSNKIVVCVNQGLFSPNTYFPQEDRKGL